jgi:hypothetical protein
MTKTRSACYTVAAIIFFVAVIRGMPPDRDEKGGIAFQVVTDKTAYTPGSALRVKFIVTNTGESPLYLLRNLSECSSQQGFFFFLILDDKNQDVRGQGCSSDSWPPEEDVERLADPQLWIRLNPGEIFGRELAFELPAKKGTYRLKAELTPTTFTSKQKDILSQRQIRVLEKPCPAPTVTITVR